VLKHIVCTRVTEFDKLAAKLPPERKERFLKEKRYVLQCETCHEDVYMHPHGLAAYKAHNLEIQCDVCSKVGMGEGQSIPKVVAVDNVTLEKASEILGVSVDDLKFKLRAIGVEKIEIMETPDAKEN